MPPIYEYECKACGDTFEVLVYGKRPGVECPTCESKSLIKLPSLFGGYQGDLGSASVKPKQAGSFKKKGKKK